MQTLDQDLKKLLESGVINRIAAFEKAANNSDNYAIPFMLDSIGIGYNHHKITSIMPWIKRFQNCTK